MNPNSNSTSSTLIRSVQRNEQEGWNKLARLYGPLVYRWTKKVGFSAEDVADIGQEVFRVVAIKINEFDLARDSGGFRAWLRQITRNKIGDRLRKLANEEQAIGEVVFIFVDELEHAPPVEDIVPKISRFSNG